MLMSMSIAMSMSMSMLKSMSMSMSMLMSMLMSILMSMCNNPMCVARIVEGVRKYVVTRGGYASRES